MGPWPYYGPEEIEAVNRVLRSGKVNYLYGPEGRLFEREYADYVGCRHGLAVANGTVSLELALHCLGVGPGDEVVVTPRTFIATASAAVLRGAIPVVADVDRDSGNLTAETIEPVLTPRTRAIICVHLGGWPCEMEPIVELASSRNLHLIEDCAQAHGAFYKGAAVGSFGDFGSFSFCNDKILSTGGEGGLLTTDNEEWWKKAWAYKDHGKDYDIVHDHSPRPPGFKWMHESWGTNWRLTEMQSAIGRVILRKLPAWVEMRRQRAHILEGYLERSSVLRLPPRPEYLKASFYKYYAYVRPEALADGWSRDRIMVELTEAGIQGYSGTCSEIYLEKAFDPYRPAQPLPVARELGETSLMFQVHPTLSEEWMHYLGETMLKILKRAER